MADAETVRRAGEAAIGDQRDLLADPLTVECRRRRQHLAHSGSALRPLVADDDDVAFLVAPLIARLARVLLAIEAQRGALEAHGVHAGGLRDRAAGRPFPLPRDQATG